MPTLTLLFEQPLQDAAMPLIHGKEANWIQEDTYYKWGLISVWADTRC